MHAVKLEGGIEYAEHVSLLTKSGIPVMGHIGFTPQSEHALGGYKVQGRGSTCDKLYKDADALERAGAFACLLELVPNNVARQITDNLEIPTVGIGAGPYCDAQILVWADMAGFSAPKSKPIGVAPSYLGGDINKSDDKSDAQKSTARLELSRVPKFVKRYANLSDVLYKAVLEYADDVKSGKYPGPDHCYE